MGCFSNRGTGDCTLYVDDYTHVGGSIIKGLFREPKDTAEDVFGAMFPAASYHCIRAELNFTEIFDPQLVCHIIKKICCTQTLSYRHYSVPN